MQGRALRVRLPAAFARLSVPTEAAQKQPPKAAFLRYKHALERRELRAVGLLTKESYE